MTEIAALAQQAIAALAPLLPLVASKAAEGFLSEPGAKLYDWLASKFKGTPAEGALDRATTEPNNPRRLESLKLEIEDLAEKDPAFRDQLAALLRELPGSVNSTQTSTQAGDTNKSAQATGNDIRINIS